LHFRKYPRFCSLQALDRGRCSAFYEATCTSTAFPPLRERCRCVRCARPCLAALGPLQPATLKPATLQHAVPLAACIMQPAELQPAALQSATCCLQRWILLPATLQLPLHVLCTPTLSPLLPATCSLAALHLATPRGRPPSPHHPRGNPWAIYKVCHFLGIGFSNVS
jgi:hypothetical protein